MKILLTLDYELFFGSNTGSVNQSIIEPTIQLRSILDPHNIKAVFFVDAGYLIALKRQKDQIDQLKLDYNLITKQIQELSAQGHAIELHIHPHWEDSFFKNGTWYIDTTRYRLAQFNEEEVIKIINKYTGVLKEITGKDPIAYRAGGWSAQPFNAIRKGLTTNNIFIDSTVFPQGYYSSSHQKFDFRKVKPYKTSYSFSEDLTVEESGKFKEIPISSIRVNPSFFWRFAAKKIAKSKEHESFGDGSAISLSFLEKIRLLTTSSYSVVSMDGYKASLLKKAFSKYVKNTSSTGNFVIIGHPKAFTSYSLKKLKDFITQVKEDHTFITYDEV